MTNAQTEARAIARCVRGCATDDQYSELVEKIATALAAKDAGLAAVHQQYVDANEARIDAEAARAEARKALEEIADARVELNNPHDYSRGWNDALFRVRQIARRAIGRKA